MSGGGSGSSTTTQKADPWSGVQPYLQSLYSRANDLMGQGGPQVAQNNGVADFTPYTQSVMGLINSFGSGADPNQQAQASLAGQFSNQNGTMGNQYYRNLMAGAVDGQNTLASAANGLDTTSSVLGGAANGTDTTSQVLGNAATGNDATSQYYRNVMGGNDASSQYLQQVLGGNYLNSNQDGLNAAMNAANANTVRQFNTAVMPQLASQFSLAGRYGSGAQSQGISDATNNLATQMANTNAGIENQNYQNERAMQNNAAGSLAGLQSGAAGNLGNYMIGAAGNLGNYRTTAAGNLGNYQNSAANNYINSQTQGAAGLSSNQLAGMQGLQQAYGNNANNLNTLGTLSDIQQQQAQSILSGNNALFNANQQQPYQNLNWFNGVLNGAMSLNGQTAQTQQSGGSKLGGALGGAAAGAMAGSAFGPIGTGVGAVGGALISVL